MTASHPGRRVFLAAALAPLAGCGFRPLYGAGPGGRASPVASELAAIQVPVLPERSGQLLRQALQARLEGSGTEVPKKYLLNVSFGIAGEALGVQPDNTPTRLRFTGTGTWTLQTLSPPRATLFSGVARRMDGLNTINSQYFAADLETETVTRRLAEAVADQITLQLATYFQRRAQAAASG